MISFAIPNFNRSTNIINLINHHQKNKQIKEILICDDNSNKEIVENLKNYIINKPKVKFIENKENLGPFRNKLRTVKNCSQEWVILCDSDNFIDQTYIYILFQENKWEKNILYCPDFAKPRFNYKQFSNFIIKNFDDLAYVNRTGSGPAFLNTGNFFFNKNNYIKNSESILNEFQFDYGSHDVIIFNYSWIKNGNKIKCIKNLEYTHNITIDSITNKDSIKNKESYYKRLNMINKIIEICPYKKIGNINKIGDLE